MPNYKKRPSKLANKYICAFVLTASPKAVKGGKVKCEIALPIADERKRINPCNILSMGHRLTELCGLDPWRDFTGKC